MSAIREVMLLHERIAELETLWEDVDHWDVVDVIHHLSQSNCKAHASVAAALRETLQTITFSGGEILMEQCPHFQDGNCQGQSMCIEDCKRKMNGEPR
jgi:hypothetical protein